MRYSSSKTAVVSGGSAALARGLRAMTLQSRQMMGQSGQRSAAAAYTIPSYVSKTTAGLTDMRTRAAKDRVRLQAETMPTGTRIPDCVSKKDGTIDMKKPFAMQFMQARGATSSDAFQSMSDDDERSAYWLMRLRLDDFSKELQSERSTTVRMPLRPWIIDESMPPSRMKNNFSCREFADDPEYVPSIETGS